MTSVISDKHIDMAFEWLNESCEQIAAARAQVIRTEFKAKKVHARLMLQAQGPEWQRKAIATTSDEYEQALDAYAHAEGVWAGLKDQQSKCEAIIEAWRTSSANNRGIVRSAA